MEAISGVFKTRARAENAVSEVLKAGISPDRVTLLTPGSVDQVNKEMLSVPTDAAEQPGMGKAIGALAGGGVGFAGGSLLMALVPGLGPITAVGLLGAAILGAAGATIGATVGNELETSATEGLPEDEIFVYEDALHQGLSGLRSAEESRYSQSSKNFAEEEEYFRRGFEAALHARTRCMEFDQVSAAMDAALEDVQREHPGAEVEEAFTRGYQRGREYYQQRCDETKKAA